MRLARREMLAATAALAAAPAVAGWAASAPRLLAVYDGRFPQSGAFARAAQALGNPLLAGGMADLVRQWRAHVRPGIAVAGLASYADMQIALGLAAEDRRPVLLLAAHTAEGHRLYRGSLPGLEPAGDGWPRQLAAHMAGLQGAGAAAGFPAASPRALWSWMLGPAAAR